MNTDTDKTTKTPSDLYAEAEQSAYASPRGAREAMDLSHWIAEGRRAAEADRALFERGTYETPAIESEARSDLAYWIRCDGANERALAALAPEEQQAALDAAWSAYVAEWPGCPALATAPACSSCGSYPAAPGGKLCTGCAGTGLDQHEAFMG